MKIVEYSGVRFAQQPDELWKAISVRAGSEEDGTPIYGETYPQNFQWIQPPYAVDLLTTRSIIAFLRDKVRVPSSRINLYYVDLPWTAKWMWTLGGWFGLHGSQESRDWGWRVRIDGDNGEVREWSLGEIARKIVLSGENWVAMSLRTELRPINAVEG